MTELELRNLVVKTAKKYLGYKESDGSHRTIVDRYNAHKPLARGYKVRYTDAWCATFVSAVAIELGLTDIMPTECGCGQMIQLYYALGRWKESDSYKPEPGDIIMYDWDDNGTGDDTGWPEHVGIVTAVTGDSVTVIEGNYNDAVGYRIVKVNGKYIRGYCLPDYASKADKVEVKQETVASPAAPAPKPENAVLEWQKAAIADGCKFPKYGADGEWGAECEAVAKVAIVRQRSTYLYKNLTKIVQKAVGVTVDGLCGSKTDAAIKAYQKKHGLVADGQVGLKTWKKILGV